MYIFGASGHGKVIASISENSGFFIEGFIDDDSTKKEVFKKPVIHAKNFNPKYDTELVIGVGNNWTRKKISELYATNYVKIIHRSAIVCDSVTIKEGTVVFPQAVINSDASIGKHCIINTGAIVEHDCFIGNYVHISPNAALAGGVKVGEGSHIGIGANVIQNIKIGNWATVGAGATIIEDIPDGAVVVGVPGKIIKMNSF